MINKTMMPLLMLLAVAFVATALTGCSKDSDDDAVLPHYIYGHWEYAGETVYGTYWGYLYWGYLFQVDGQIQIWQDDHQGYYSIVPWGTFTIEDGKIHIYKNADIMPTPDVFSFSVSELTPSRLVIHEHIDSWGQAIDNYKTFRRMVVMNY